MINLDEDYLKLSSFGAGIKSMMDSMPDDTAVAKETLEFMWRIADTGAKAIKQAENMPVKGKPSLSIVKENEDV